MTTPRLCCAECFDDRYLRGVYSRLHSKQLGTCSYCGSRDQALFDPIGLRAQFELLISIYTPDANGRTLVEWLKEDWALFGHERMDIVHAKELLAEILDDGQIVRAHFSASHQSRSDALIRWDELRTELMHTNRFFPKTAIDFDRLEELLNLLMAEDIPKVWYRARINQSDEPYRVGEMGCPPKHLASHGRANPAGIPYLYLASQESTAISEVRPHPGDAISVARFEVPDDLRIVDLRHPRRTISPFTQPDEDELANLRRDIEFLEKLGEELTRPVLQKAAAFDYIPSQYLCEFAKKCGFSGVMYRSSVEGGINMALFEPDCARPIEVSMHSVRRVIVETE